MNNPEKLETYGTQGEEKQNKKATQSLPSLLDIYYLVFYWVYTGAEPI
jgi:hypothetical protein